MNKVKAVVSRKRFYGAGLLIALMAVAIWQFNTRSTSAQSTGGFGGAIFTVTPKTGTFNLTGVLAGDAFQQEGTITFKNLRGDLLALGTGVFRRSGVKVNDGLAIVTDIYELTPFNGALVAQGVIKGEIVGIIESADLLAVTGGVGTFRSASGEAQLTTTDATSGAFNVVLEESPRPPRFGNLVTPPPPPKKP